MVDMLMCSGSQCWICHVQWWSMLDMLMCSGGQCWICSCAVLVNKGVLNVNLPVRQNSSQIFPRQKIVKKTLHECYRTIIMLNSFN